MKKNNQIYNSLYTPLKELGLSEAEIDVYIISLKLGPSQISTIAEHLGIARPNIYKIIKSLEKRGLSKFTTEEKYQRNFVVEPPTVILEKFRKKEENFIQKEKQLIGAMPYLIANYQQGNLPTKIKIYQGKEDFRKIFFNILEETDDVIWFCGSAKDFIGFISWSDERKWIRERTKKNLFIKALLLPSMDAKILKRTDSKELRETRIMKDISPFSTSFQLFANKVIFWQPIAPLALVIEDKYLVEMMKSLVEKLWKEN